MTGEEAVQCLAAVIEDLLAIHAKNRVAVDEVAQLPAKPQGMDWHLVTGELRLCGGRAFFLDGSEFRAPRLIGLESDSAFSAVRDLRQHRTRVADDAEITARG